MREIKFRAWDLKRELMYEQLPHNSNKNTNRLIYIGDSDGQTNVIKVHREVPFVQDWISIYDVVLMQYTGLKDKDDVEIYEGDICRCYGGAEFNGHFEYNKIYEVKWQGSGFDMVIDDCGYGWNYSSGFDYIEVIGNIYENKELLNEQ